MTNPSIGAALDRIRIFRKANGWAINRIATEASVPEATLRGMDDAAWNPTARTVEKLEAIIPPDWRAPDPSPATAQPTEVAATPAAPFPGGPAAKAA